LKSFAQGGETLSTCDDFCAHVRAVNYGNAEIEDIDDNDLWEMIVAGKVELF